MNKTENIYSITIIWMLLLIILSLTAYIGLREFYEAFKVVIPFITAFIGILGTLLINSFFKSNDSLKENIKQLNIFKGRVGFLIRRFEFYIQIDNRTINPIEMKKISAVSNFKDAFFKFEMDKKLDAIGESEEYFVDKSEYTKIEKVNHLFMEIQTFTHQITRIQEFSEKTRKNEEDYNIFLYDVINEKLQEIKEISKLL
ncbi:hypothetical protein V4V34_07220 [Lysinibacillus sphaericus]|uniref:hypothetical protein n=1 Tax=Lysinibacillus sphaericus TaxID=1421 RepID=UPI002FBD7422